MIPAPVQKQARLMFRHSGMEMIAQPPGMYAEELQPPSRHASELELRRVSGESTRLDFAHLSSIIFSLPFQTSSDIYGSPTLWEGPMTGWVGYFHDRPVCIVTVVIAGGVLGVYSVGTLPEYQRRGFAETAMRHALAVAGAETGIRASILQSTAQGMNLYARMGYRVVTRFGVYLNEGNGSH
jgi:ribosomal protein S18 acetylase RimI-like enzyme